MSERKLNPRSRRVFFRVAAVALVAFVGLTVLVALVLLWIGWRPEDLQYAVILRKRQYVASDEMPKMQVFLAYRRKGAAIVNESSLETEKFYGRFEGMWDSDFDYYLETIPRGSYPDTSYEWVVYGLTDEPLSPLASNSLASPVSGDMSPNFQSPVSVLHWKGKGVMWHRSAPELLWILPDPPDGLIVNVFNVKNGQHIKKLVATSWRDVIAGPISTADDEVAFLIKDDVQKGVEVVFVGTMSDDTTPTRFRLPIVWDSSKDQEVFDFEAAKTDSGRIVLVETYMDGVINKLFVCGFDGRLTEFEAPYKWENLSPKGHYLSLDNHTFKKHWIVSLDWNTGKVRKIAKVKGHADASAWSQDDSYYVSCLDTSISLNAGLYAYNVADGTLLFSRVIPTSLGLPCTIRVLQLESPDEIEKRLTSFEQQYKAYRTGEQRN